MAQEVALSMADDSNSQERSRETVRRWYHGHADEYNEKRRQKYQDDPDARKRARERARKYRERRRKGNAVSDDPLYRYVNGSGPCEYGVGTRIEVWTTGQIAEELGATPQMLRNWEKKGWIPDSIFPDKHRLYTGHQKSLIIGFAMFMSSYRKSPKKYKKQLADEVENMKNLWSAKWQ